jgi:hypothetical protein
MSPRKSDQGADLVYSELSGAIIAAPASGHHCDHDLLVLHERVRSTYRASSDAGSLAAFAQFSGGSQDIPKNIGRPEEAYRQTLLRSLASTLARSPVGIAAKLAVACHLNGHFEAAKEVALELHDSRIIISALLDSMMQAQVLPVARQAPRH